MEGFLISIKGDIWPSFDVGLVQIYGVVPMIWPFENSFKLSFCIFSVFVISTIRFCFLSTCFSDFLVGFVYIVNGSMMSGANFLGTICQ